MYVQPTHATEQQDLPPPPSSKSYRKLLYMGIMLGFGLTGCGLFFHGPTFDDAICPSRAPVRCDSWCCPTNTVCNPKGRGGRLCRSIRNVPVASVCPAEVPNVCGGVCCPRNAFCNPTAPLARRCIIFRASADDFDEPGDWSAPDDPDDPDDPDEAAHSDSYGGDNQGNGDIYDWDDPDDPYDPEDNYDPDHPDDPDVPDDWFEPDDPDDP